MKTAAVLFLLIVAAARASDPSSIGLMEVRPADGLPVLRFAVSRLKAGITLEEAHATAARHHPDFASTLEIHQAGRVVGETWTLKGRHRYGGSEHETSTSAVFKFDGERYRLESAELTYDGEVLVTSQK
jgi:hypothetical protein